jgi:phosphoribosylformimino-5-aminoimidazole carboxamide ribotide isomerase
MANIFSKDYKIKVYPAIDLKAGKCVRLYKGDMNQVTIFNENPAQQAKEFENEGFSFLHIVDLDGAIAGKSINEEVVKKIIKNISIPVQLGGGIRNIENIEKWLNIGVDRVIIGTMALRNPDLVVKIAQKFPNRIVIGIDARNQKVAVSGWVEKSEIDVIDLAKKFENSGVAAIIYTDIERDGTLEGVDIEGTKRLVEAVKIPIIASGGVCSIEDVKKLEKITKLNGVVIGKALYNNNI